MSIKFCPICGNAINNGQGNAVASCAACGYRFQNNNSVQSSGNYDGVNINGYNANYSGANNYGAYNGYLATNNEPVEDFNLISAYKSMFRKYAKFDGRSRRSEFWYAYLANCIIWLLLSILMTVSVGTSISLAEQRGILSGNALVPAADSMVFSTIMVILLAVYAVATFIPLLAMCVRRLHDSGKSGWFYLIGLIPYAGSIIMIVLYALDSQIGPNQYGPNPKGWN